MQFPLFRKADKANGTMSVLESSHKLGELSYKSEQKTKDSLINLIPKNIELYQKKFKEVYCIMKRGDVVIFSNDTLHRSNYNTSSYTRFSGVVRINSINKLEDDHIIEKKISRKNSD